MVHIGTYKYTSFFLMFTVFYFIPSLNQSAISGHLGCFQVFAIEKNASTLYILLCTHVQPLSIKIEIAGQRLHTLLWYTPYCSLQKLYQTTLSLPAYENACAHSFAHWIC